MPLFLTPSTSSMDAQRSLTINGNQLAKTMAHLASGYRITSAGDDAAGLALSEKLRGQIRGSQKALDNIQDGIGVLNIADGAMQGISDYLQRMRELAVQAGNDTYSAAQRTAIKGEIDQMASGISSVSSGTQYNGVSLLDGTTASLRVQTGANSTAATNTFDLAAAGVGGVFGAVDAATLSVNALFVDTSTNALASIASLDTAITTVNTRRGNIGALTNRLETTSNTLSSVVENTSSAESRIRNVDVASETANLSRNQILQQAAAAMLTQANQTPQLALQLLRG
jgi:flagellin